MNIKIKNISMYENISIDLGQINIFTGKNDTGKSTVLKILYAFLDQNYKEMLEEIDQQLYSIVTWNPRRQFKEEVDLNGLINSYLEKEADVDEKEKINKLLDLKKDENKLELYSLFIEQTLDMQFSRKVKNIFHEDENLYFEFQNKNDTVKYENSLLVYENKNITDVIFVDLSNDYYFPKNNVRIGKKISLFNRIDSFYSDNFEEIYTKKNQKNQQAIITYKKEIEKVLTFFDNPALKIGNLKGNKYIKDGVELPIQSQAGGVKSLVLIKTLLENGHIKKGTLLMIDEPEKELHPQWQVYLGQLLYEISINLDVTLILTTHSGYFVDIMDKIKEIKKSDIKFFICEKEGPYNSVINEVDDTAQIYENLSSAFSIIDIYGESDGK